MRRWPLLLAFATGPSCGGDTSERGALDVAAVCSACSEEHVDACRSQQESLDERAGGGCGKVLHAYRLCLREEANALICSTDGISAPIGCHDQEMSLGACLNPAGECATVLTPTTCELLCAGLEVKCTGTNQSPFKCSCSGFGKSMEFARDSCVALAPGNTPCDAP